MRKLLRFADAIVLLCGTLGMLLQFWVRMSGPDEKGLYPASHPGWILSWILTAAVAVFIWLLTRQAGNSRSYKANFPASIVGALGCAAAAAAVALSGIQRLRESILWLDTLAGYAGILSGVGLMAAAVFRFLGKKPPFVCYMLPCVFFCLHVFYLGRELGGEPEPVRYLLRYLATLSLIPASYQLWGFCVGDGDRQKSLFWSLLSGFLCILSCPMGTNGFFYIALGFWLLSNPCALKYLPRRSRPAPQLEPEPETGTETAEAMPEIPSTMEEDFLPAPQPAADLPTPEMPNQEELDPDAIIAEILREIDSNVP